MNQNKIKVNPKIYQKKWAIFTCVHIFVFFIGGFFVLGGSLWFQALLLSIVFSALGFWIFFKALKSLFSLQEVKGYDSWHLRPLLDNMNFPAQVFVTENEAPFCFAYEFFAPRLILSSALLNNLQRNELENLLSFQKVYFENGWSRRLTQFTYVIGVLLSPLFILNKFLNQISVRFFNPIFLRFLTWFFSPVFSVFSFRLFYSLDQQIISKTKDKKEFVLLLQKLQSYLDHSSFFRPICFRFFF